MAKGKYISINTDKIGSACLTAEKAGKQIETTRTELTALQKKLTASQNLLQDHYGVCFDKAVPTAELKKQKELVDKIVALMQEAAALAQSTTSDMQKRTDALQLALKALKYGGVAKYSNSIALIIGLLAKETDCGDDYAYVGSWNTKAYTNSKKNWSETATDANKGIRQDYSDFNVVQGFDEKFVLNQRNYYKGPVACTATSDAIVASIVTGKLHEPSKSYWSGDACNWPNTKKIPNTKSISVEKQCEIIAENVSEGNPVVLRVPGHSVVAVGLRQGVDPAAATPDDILIIDPGDGKVKTANEVYSGWYDNTKHLGMTDNNGWSLRVYKNN